MGRYRSFARRNFGIGSGLLTAAAAISRRRRSGGKTKHSGKGSTKQKPKHKHPAGGSMTKTQNSGEKMEADDLHSGLSEKHIVIRLNKRLKHKCLGKWKYAQNWAAQYTATAGNQLVTMIAGFCQRNQVLVSSPAPNVLQLRENLFDLNPAIKLPGSTLIPVNNTPATDRIAIFRVRHNILLTNFESVSTVVYLYFITPKRDVVAYADQVWTQGLSSAGGEGLLVAARTRAAAGVYSGTTVGACAPTDVFQKPSDCRIFNDYYRILKVKKIKLAAAATEEIVSTVHINKIVNRAALQDNGIDNVRGMTVQILAVAYSQVVDDQTAGPSPSPTTGPINLGMVSTSTYFCGMTAASMNRVDDFFTQQQMAENVLPANAKTINILDAIQGVIQT